MLVSVLFAHIAHALLVVPDLSQSQRLLVEYEREASLAPLFHAAVGKAIAGQYIAVMGRAASDETQLVAGLSTLALSAGVSVEPFGFSAAFHAAAGAEASPFPRGFIFKHLSHSDVSKIRALKNIEFIEEDQEVSLDLPITVGVVDTSSRAPSFWEGEAGEVVQDQPPWGLARVSHTYKPDYDEVDDFVFYKNDGLGVDVYVVDTGINIEHVEFEGRAYWGATIPQGDEDVDGNGHGTHVAGTIAGKNFGVAKNANVIAVKVLRSNGSGSMSDVLKGIEWVAREHIEKNKDESTNKKKKIPGPRTGNKKSVANMSLGGGKSEALDRAVDGAVTVGVHFAVAAGNSNADACRFSPAASTKAITVLATTIDDERASFSNWGKCVDIGAPGHQIISSWIGSPTANNTISGTSMASPHVAGVVAAYVSRVESGWDIIPPEVLKARLIDVSIKNVISGMPKRTGTKNRLLFNSAPEHEHESLKVQVTKNSEESL